ncbi:MAG: hypothetical protein E2O39_05715 [Planctomycetota bacterium]|nr:MAG: hypothetical protein E2O39_05715 [Planctomycetota bacterium]
MSTDSPPRPAQPERRRLPREPAADAPGSASQRWVSLEAHGEGSVDFATQVVERLVGRGRGYARYELEEEIARGGQGAILRVWAEEWPELDDGFTWHAPVGTFAVNPFGLHDVLGNVWEWCRDGFDPAFYRRVPGLDPLADPERYPTRVNRGGSFYGAPSSSRCATRNSSTPGYASNIAGVRPVRGLSR